MMWSVFASALAAACSKPLPDEGSASAELYRERCGGCHRLYAPASLKYPLWEMAVTRMETNITRSGRPPLAPAEKETILAYLREHASR